MTAVLETEAGLPAPQDRLVTLPEGLPELTLGWEMLAWYTQFLRHANGPRAGQRWECVESQVLFLLWWYAVDQDGRWLYGHGIRRLAKGAGKSPFAAAWSLGELCGPCRIDDFDPALPGGVKGRRQPMALVQIAATSEAQTANTMRQVRAMTSKKSYLVQTYGLDPGKTVIYMPDGSQLEVITSSASAAEGAETTAAVLDETEHWNATNGGTDLASVIDRNLGKSGSRGMETCNSWKPGDNSVAEQRYDNWVKQEEGLTISEDRILYDARIAPPNTSLKNREKLTEAIQFVYDDCYWQDPRTLVNKILSLRTSPEDARRFYLNQPTADARAWCSPQEAGSIVDRSPDIVKDGDKIAMFFDGSRTDDASALIGCHIETGHCFVLGIWEPRKATRSEPAIVVQPEQVDAAVEFAFDKYEPVAFFSDVKEWETLSRTEWHRRYSDRLSLWSVPNGKEPMAVAWDMRDHAHVHDFTKAAELTLREIQDRLFTYDGDSRLGRHIVNARRYPNKWGVSISKESRGSSKKIDGCVAMIGARMARRLYLAWEAEHGTSKIKKKAGQVWGFD